MAEKMSVYENPFSYFSELKGEKFTGKFVDSHTMTSVDWMVIKTTESEWRCAEIEEEFERKSGKVFAWIVSTFKCAKHFEDSYKYELTINWHDRFSFSKNDRRGLWKYSDKMATISLSAKDKQLFIFLEWLERVKDT